MASLLPKTHKDFSSKQYWNTFFAKRGTKAFEWYGEYAELCGILHKYIRPKDKILVAGCGNSTISADLYRVGYKDIINADISEIVVRQMEDKYGLSCPDMKWVQMDLTASSFTDEEFSCVLDKGTLDALMTDSSPEVVATINKYFNELGRLLRVGGRYVCVSLLQEHIIAHVLEWFPKNGWMVRVCRCEDAEKSQSDNGSFSFPVFVLVCTKFKQMPNFKPVIEVQFHGEEVKRAEAVTKVMENVTELQQYALLRHNLQSQRVAGDNMTVELCDSINGGCRYKLHIVDLPKKSNSLKFAVFIVPYGREQEWMFGTIKGREKLAEHAGASRLIVVHLARDQTYENLKAIQDELSAKVMELAPCKLPAHTKVPFLSVGEDLGHKEEVKRGNSQFSGDYVVEDIHPPGASKLRRLIFLSNQNVIQSEAKFTTTRDKKKKKERLIIDYSYLSCDHHLAMVGGLGRLSMPADVLLIGLGGGPLAMYIHKYIPKVCLTAVELDPSMVEVAKDWFGFVPDARLKVEVCDGLDYISRMAEEGTKFSAIFFDVDSKDLSVGMSCPPKSFVERPFLEKVATCLPKQGLLVLNLVCREETLKSSVISDIKTVFPSILCQEIPEEVNCILFCSMSSQKDNLKLDFMKGLECINRSLKQLQGSREEVISVSDVSQNLSVL